MIDLNDATLMEKIEFLRANLMPGDVADMCELEVVAGKVRSPFNDADNTPSCHLYEDGFFCFSSGKGGDVIDLYRALSGKSLGKAVNDLIKGTAQLDPDPDRVQRLATKELPDLHEQFMAIPHIQDKGMSDLWAERLSGVSPTHIRMMASFGYLRMDFHRMAIPHWHGGAVRGIKLRAANGQKSAVPGSTFACGLYTGADDSTGGTTAIITEGESDCWALDRHFVGQDVDVFALPSGAGLWKDAWLSQLEQYETIYTAFDNDRAGKQATEKVRSAIGWGRWKELAVPTLFNDCREALSQGWQPKLA